MAVNMSPIPPKANGTTTPSPADDEEFFNGLLRLREAVIAGSHPHFRLSQAAILRLKADLCAPAAAAGVSGEKQNSDAALNGSASKRSPTARDVNLHAASHDASFSGLPGLPPPSGLASNGAAGNPSWKSTSFSGLNPIFLEKSESLVRAERRLKRERIERELQDEVQLRKYSAHDRDAGTDAAVSLDLDSILACSRSREDHISGLQPKSNHKDAPSSSFDENDYYSSQVQSDWSSEAGANGHSDLAAGSFTADFELLEEPGCAKGSTDRKVPSNKRPTTRDMAPWTSVAWPPTRTREPEEIYGNDEDDEYTPPDASAFDSFREDGQTFPGTQATPEDENSEYEPGELTQESTVPTPYRYEQEPEHSPYVPVFRNHLTHIAAPQPNRVSPLAVAKGPSVELELVNGRPEVVQKPRHGPTVVHSPASSASRSGNGAGGGGGGKKRRNKKRKRENESSGRSKRQRDRDAAANRPASQLNTHPVIKDEPFSPPQVMDVPPIQRYDLQSTQWRPPEINLESPMPPRQAQYVNNPPQSALRYEYVPASSTNITRMSSPPAYHGRQDSQGLASVGSLHYRQRPQSPRERAYSVVASHRPPSIAHRESMPALLTEYDNSRYQGHPSGHVRYMRGEHSPPAPKPQEYYNSQGGQPARVAQIPAPAVNPRRIVVDQYGNRYYAEEVDPVPTWSSAAPNERRLPSEFTLERASSRGSRVLSQPSHLATQYSQPEKRMAPPPLRPQRRVVTENYPMSYNEPNGYTDRDYGMRALESSRRGGPPTSPVYQPMPRFDTMPPPRAPSVREFTSPSYGPRNYSVQPENVQEPPTMYAPRQASVAPVQYVRQEVPQPAPRARSVMPTYGHDGSYQRQGFSYVPQQVRYVDQNGKEIDPRQIRHVSEFRYQ